MAEEPRPPYVRFEYRPVEDREQTIETGHFSSKDVAFAIITPPGSRDTTEKEAEVWLADLRKASNEGRFPETWTMAYENGYKQWKETNEDPEFGTSIKTWPAISQAQLRNILGANIRTIEELAEANEAALNRIGMGSRALKDKAQAWLDTANSKGKTASELNSLRVENTELKAKLETQAKDIETLKSQFEALKKEPA